LERREKDLELWKNRLADYFCEDMTIFKIDDCFLTIHKFCLKMSSAISENNERKTKEIVRTNSVRSNSNSKHELSTNKARNSADFSWLKASQRRHDSLSASQQNLTQLQELNDLEDYTNVELNSSLNLRRRLSRKSSLKERNSGNPSHLIDFLTNGDRELHPRNLSNSGENTTRITQQKDYRSIEPVQEERPSYLNIKRYSSLDGLSLNSQSNTHFNSPLNSKPIHESPDEANEKLFYPHRSTSNVINSGVTVVDTNDDNNMTNEYQVTLRRSVSVSQVDRVTKNQRRREITSEVMTEEDMSEMDTQSSLNKNDEKSNRHRLSGLKKLGTLYKTFEDDFEQQKANQSNKESSQNEHEDDTSDRKFSSSSIEASVFTQSSQKLRSNTLSNSTTNESPTSHFGSATSLVSNRILKFEKTDSSSTPTPPHETDNPPLILKRANTFTEPSSSLSPRYSKPINFNEDNDSKVKSLSTKWEKKTSTVSSNDTHISNVKGIVLNSATSKQRNRTNEETNEVFRDEGFETQSNGSSSQTSEIISTQYRLNHPAIISKQAYPISNKTNINLNPLSSARSNPPIQSTTLPEEEETVYKSEISIQRTTSLNTGQTRPTLRQTFAINKKPTSSIQQIVPKLDLSSQKRLNLSGATAFSPPTSPLPQSTSSCTDDPYKRRSGSALYLCDTESTKAKKLELKQRYDQKSPINLAYSTNSIPSTVSQLRQQSDFSSPLARRTNATSTLLNSSVNQQQPMKRPDSKININLINSSHQHQHQQQQQHQNQQQQQQQQQHQLQTQLQNSKSNSNISLTINCSSALQPQVNQHGSEAYAPDITKKPSVFDRLSKNIKKQHDVH
jgi:hypothetical protein